MNVQEHGRKAMIVWRAMHLSAFITAIGIISALINHDAANGIGVIVGSFQLALGGFVSVYANSQGKVDVAETAHGPHPKRMTQQMQAQP